MTQYKIWPIGQTIIEQAMDAYVQVWNQKLIGNTFENHNFFVLPP